VSQQHQIHSPNITEEHAQLLSKRANIGYINFGPNDATDTAHLTQLNVAWLDSLNLADAAIESLLRRNLRDDIIFNRYFNGNDAAQHANVVNVFRAIAGPMATVVQASLTSSSTTSLTISLFRQAMESSPPYALIRPSPLLALTP
jgi:hypothetical protein